MIKSIFDKTFSLIGIIIFLPLLLILPIIIFVQDRGNPFYCPKRVGKNNKNFTMIKFRSMILNADKNKIDSTKNDDERITPIGRIIRKYKLDEIIQLINVLFGTMSLVGPRPNVKRETDLYTEEEKQILTVKPGITDFSSIVFSDEGNILENSINPNLDYNQLIRPWKSRLCILYIEKNDIIIDIQIIFLTILSMVNRKASLKMISKIVKKISNNQELSKICLREKKLVPTPPPGNQEIVQSRDYS